MYMRVRVFVFLVAVYDDSIESNAAIGVGLLDAAGLASVRFFESW